MTNSIRTRTDEVQNSNQERSDRIQKWMNEIDKIELKKQSLEPIKLPSATQTRTPELTISKVEVSGESEASEASGAGELLTVGINLEIPVSERLIAEYADNKKSIEFVERLIAGWKTNESHTVQELQRLQNQSPKLVREIKIGTDFLEKIKNARGGLEALYKRLVDPKEKHIKNLADFEQKALNSWVWYRDLGTAKTLFKDSEFLRFIEKKLDLTPFQEQTIQQQVGKERLEAFQDIPFVKRANDLFLQLSGTSQSIVSRLKNGELRKEVPASVLRQDDSNLGTILGPAVQITLRKLEADREEVTVSVSKLKNLQLELSTSEEGLLNLLEGIQYEAGTENPIKEIEELSRNPNGQRERLRLLQETHRKRVNLDVALQTIKNQRAKILEEIDELFRTLNLINRMKRAAVLKAATELRSTCQKKINSSEVCRLAVIRLQEERPNADPTPTEIRESNLPATRSEFPKFLVQLGKERAEQELYAQRLDILFQQEFIKLQDQDADSVQGQLPIDGWIPWVKDFFRDQTGLAESSRRLGQERINTLTIDKLLADQGVDLKGAYGELLKSIQQITNIRDSAKQRKQLTRLVNLPRWIYENPHLAQEFIRNIQLVISELYARSSVGGVTNILTAVTDYLHTDAFVQDILLNNRDTEDSEIAPGSIALLDLTRYAPALVAAANRQNTALGKVFSGIFGNAVGETVGNVFQGAAEAVAARTIAQNVVQVFPQAGRMLEVAQHVASGAEFGTVSFAIIQRRVVAEVLGFVRDIRQLGFRITFREVGKNLRSWWNLSSPWEKGVRAITEVGLIGIGTALCFTGVGAVAGVPLIALGVGMRWVNEHIIFRGTAVAIREDRLQRRRNERRYDPAKYSDFLSEMVRQG